MPYFSLKSDKKLQRINKNYPNTLETTFFAYALLQDTYMILTIEISLAVYMRFFRTFDVVLNNKHTQWHKMSNNNII